MSIFDKFRGKPTFSVEFAEGEKGLGQLVALATGGQPGQYLLGQARLQPPLAGIEVIMGIEEDGTYSLDAKMQKGSYWQKLKPDFGLLQKAGFRVISSLDKDMAYLFSPRLPPRSKLTYSVVDPSYASLEYRLNPNNLRMASVHESMAAYANALELLVQGISARGGVPQVLKLGNGEEIGRIVTEAERMDFQFRKKQLNDKNGK